MGPAVEGSYIDEPLALINGSNTYFYADNRVYSPAALTDVWGAVVERYRYDSYGNRTIFASDDSTVRTVSSYGNQRGFTGCYADTESGLYYARARMYSPTLGRFIGRDAAGYVNGMGLYAGYFVPANMDPYGFEEYIDRSLRVPEPPKPPEPSPGFNDDPRDWRWDGAHWHNIKQERVDSIMTAIYNLQHPPPTQFISSYTPPKMVPVPFSNFDPYDFKMVEFGTPEYQLANTQAQSLSMAMAVALPEVIVARGPTFFLGESLATAESEVALTQYIGQIKGVNEGAYGTFGRTYNCINCAIAVDRILAGEPFVSAGISSGGDMPGILEDMFKGTFEDVGTTPAALQSYIAQYPVGSRFIVMGKVIDSDIIDYHVFNGLVTPNGPIFINGQIEGIQDVTQFQSFGVLPTCIKSTP